MIKQENKIEAHLNKQMYAHPLYAVFFLLILWVSFYSGVINADVYRWTDDNGDVHYGDKPNSSEAKQVKIRETATSSIQRTRAIKVNKVIDGDTLELADGTRVRLLGINTPELPRRGKPGQPGGEAASKMLSELIEDSKHRVHLSFDVERNDHYGRLLAYIHDTNGLFINAELLRLGYGHTSFKKPRMKQEKVLLAAEKEARDANRGIWKQEQFRVTTPGRLKDSGNQYRLLRGKVRSDKPISKNRRRLELTSGFFLLVNEGVSLPFSKYNGLTILVRGWIRTSKGTPWMKVEHPSQIETVK